MSNKEYVFDMPIMLSEGHKYQLEVFHPNWENESNRVAELAYWLESAIYGVDHIRANEIIAPDEHFESFVAGISTGVLLGHIDQLLNEKLSQEELYETIFANYMNLPYTSVADIAKTIRDRHSGDQ